MPLARGELACSASLWVRGEGHGDRGRVHRKASGCRLLRAHARTLLQRDDEASWGHAPGQRVRGHRLLAGAALLSAVRGCVPAPSGCLGTEAAKCREARCPPACPPARVLGRHAGGCWEKARQGHGGEWLRTCVTFAQPRPPRVLKGFSRKGCRAPAAGSANASCFPSVRVPLPMSVMRA